MEALGPEALALDGRANDAESTGAESTGAGSTGAESTGAEPTSAVAELIGYGPIAHADLRDTFAGLDTSIGASAWEAISVSQRGEVLSVDRYRPPEAIQRFVRARDLHCRFPGCRVAAHRCDIDHIEDAACGGATSTENLALLCRGHHTLKHHSGWRYRHDRGGTMEWTSPNGRAYREPPPSQFRYTGDWAQPQPPGGADFDEGEPF